MNERFSQPCCVADCCHCVAGAELPARPSDLAASAERSCLRLPRPTSTSIAIPSSRTTKRRHRPCFAAELRKLGYTVTEHVGKYPDGSQAYRRRGDSCRMALGRAC